MQRITSHDEVREILGDPLPRVADKDRNVLHAYDKKWLAASSFCLVATCGADGTCDVSPKGDPPGFTLVLDDRTIVVPERPGNRRGAGFHKPLGKPPLGLISPLPRRGG